MDFEPIRQRGAAKAFGVVGWSIRRVMGSLAAILLLASTGLLVTFSAGLWNIGVEGQIIAGARGYNGDLQGFSHGALHSGRGNQ